MSTDYNAYIEIKTRQVDDDDLIDALAGYGPVVSRSERGWVAIDITVPATDLRQAFSTSLAIVEAATAHPVLAVEVMPTEEFDVRNGLAPLPSTMGVPEAAELLGISPQAVRKRLEAGTLAGHREGRDWRIQRAAVKRGTLSLR